MNTRRWIATACLLLTVIALSRPASAAERWQNWRGPNHNGIVENVQFNPSAVDGSPDIQWTAEVGEGYSTVSVVGPYLYTMGNIGDKDIVYCLRTDTGDEVWRHTYKCKAASYPGPRATPCIIGGATPLVITVSRDAQIHAMNAKTGKVVWQRNGQRELGADIPTWGVAGSPVVHDNVLLLNLATHGVALDPGTGRTLWKSPGGKGGYSSPVVASINGRKTVVLFGEKDLYGVDFATGKKLFSHPWQTKHNVNAADPIVMGKTIFIGSGYDRGCALLDVSRPTPSIIWENTNLRSHINSAVLLDGHLYGVDGNNGRGQFVCVNASTGLVKWTERLPFGSLIAADKLLVYFSERGSLHVAKASPSGYSEIASAKTLLPRVCWTSPVLCNGQLYLRNSKGTLLCLNVK